MKKVLILYASFGGGHYCPALAMKQKIEKENADTEALMFDMAFLHNNRAIEKLERWYSYSIESARWQYYLLYLMNYLKPVRFLEHSLIYWQIMKTFKNLLMQNRPDEIYLFHFNIWAIGKIVKKVLPACKITAAVTDPYSTPPVWFDSKNRIDYLVLSEVAKNNAVKAGVMKEKIKIVQPWLREEFFIAKDYSKQKIEDIKDKLLIPKNKKIIFCLGGSVGARRLTKLINGIVNEVPDAIVITVGLSKKALDYLQKNINNLDGKIILNGVVPKMADYFSVADVVLSKAGASVVFEALFLNKPLILIDYIWGQEKGTKDWVVKEKLGRYEPDLKKAPALIRELLGVPNRN